MTPINYTISLRAASLPRTKIRGKLKEDCLAEIVNAPTVEAVSREEFRTAVNELCRLCGCYTNEHDGACNGCKWRERRG